MGGTATAARLRVELDRKRITLADEGREDQWRIDQVRRASTAYGRGWSIVFDDAARLLAAVPMPPAAAALLWWSLTALHPRDWTRLTQAEIASAVGVERSTVSKALAHLVERGCICRDKRGGLRLSLWLAWQGTAPAYQKARRSRAGEIAAAQQWHLERAPAEHELAPARYWRLEDEAEARPAKATTPRAMVTSERRKLLERQRPANVPADEWAAMIDRGEIA